MNESTTARIDLLRAELRDDTATVATDRPRLSWTVATDRPGWVQASASLRSGDVEVHLDGDDSALVSWPFEPLAAGEERDVRVRARSVDGVETDWSEPLTVRAGFLAADEWIAQPVGLAGPAFDAQPVALRTSFTLDRPVSRATLFWTALGVAEPEVNGAPVSDDVLSPGWTAYRDRLVHETVDVTDLVREGENVLAATLAGCWYTEKFGYFGQAKRVYGDQPSFLAQLRVDYADGTRETLAATGDQWRASGDGPVVTSGLYAGEHQDLRRVQPGWSQPGFDDSAWAPARVAARALPGYENVPVPEARISPPVRRGARVAVDKVLTSPSGATIVDFGQNVGGRVRLRVDGTAGDRITLHHAEVLENGELCLRPLRFAKQEAVFDLADGENLLESRFTSYGFRYVQVDGWPGEIEPERIEAIAVHTDMPQRAWFDSSHDMLTRLHENVLWTLRADTLSLPTDCPQRDERLGFTGDLQLFSPAMATLVDADAFLASWMRDVAAEQRRNDGNVPTMAPDAIPGLSAGLRFALYGDTACVVPMVLHERYGDVEVLRRHLPGMKAWIAAVVEVAGDSGLWQGTPQLSDWLDPDAPPSDPGKAKVDPDVVATACFARCLQLIAEAAAILGEDEDAAHYGAFAERSRQAFIDTFITPSGRIMSDAATAYTVAIGYDIVRDPALRLALGDRLAELVRRSGYRISTGFLGTPLICDALTATGHLAAAERLMTQTACPSWLYPVTMGATTIWERWDSLRPDGSVNPGEMTSFNHYAIGSIADWMHRTIAGLAPDSAGYRRIRIAPRPLDALDHATSRQRTPYGDAEVSWQRGEGDLVTVRAIVPPNSSAVFDLPGHDEEQVGSGTHTREFSAPRHLPHGGPFSIASTLGDIIDNPPAYDAFLTAVEEYVPERAEAIRSGTKWVSTYPLIRALQFVPAPTVAKIDERLRAVPTGA